MTHLMHQSAGQRLPVQPLHEVISTHIPTKTMGKSKKKPQGNKKVSKREKLRQLQKIIDNANAQVDPLSALPADFVSVPLSLPTLSSSAVGNNDVTSTSSTPEQARNTSATIQYYSSQSLPKNILQQCLELFETNMGEMYKQSKWGLDMNEKLNELQHNDARFLVITTSESSDEVDSATGTSEPSSDTANNNNEIQSSNNKDKQSTVVGFAHFRYEPNDEDTPTYPITYLYELQIHPSYQRRLGLGKKLMTLIELLSLKLQMKSIMLTVFNYNEGAMAFYKRMKYGVDESSPSNFVGNEDCDYEILSKRLLVGASK